jgi:hypothetical protein
MKRKTLYALALLLFLSTVAFSKERARFRCGSSDPTCASATSATTATTATTATSGATTAESHALLHTFIKLLYI